MQSSEVDRRRSFTESRWSQLDEAVRLETAHRDFWRPACVYVIGSMARDEAGAQSDLDVMVMDEIDQNQRLSGVEYAHLVAALDNARSAAGFRPFSRGGFFLRPHSARETVQEIGGVEDNASNRFTARMLLLLNSRPLVNEAGYEQIRSLMLDAYWRQAADPAQPFRPVYLINDIRRWWHELCLNFERGNPPVSADRSTKDAELARAKRRVANLKLRYMRLLAAYTPIIGLLSEDSGSGITREQADAVLRATPLKRLSTVSNQGDLAVQSSVEKLVSSYDAFLTYMDGDDATLHERVLGPAWPDAKNTAYAFGDEVWNLIQKVGSGKELLRYVVV